MKNNPEGETDRYFDEIDTSVVFNVNIQNTVYETLEILIRK